jgi:hypothetical protein
MEEANRGQLSDTKVILKYKWKRERIIRTKQNIVAIFNK